MFSNELPITGFEPARAIYGVRELTTKAKEF